MSEIPMPKSYTQRVVDRGVVKYFGAMGPRQTIARDAMEGVMAREAMKLEDPIWKKWPEEKTGEERVSRDKSQTARVQMTEQATYQMPWVETQDRGRQMGQMTRDWYNR